MRIGIITLRLHTNYGGILQAYALQTVLERMGHNVVLIEKYKAPLSLPKWKMPLSYGKRIIKRLFGKKCIIFYEKRYNQEMQIISKNTNEFINKYINRVIIKDFSEIGEDDFNAIIVGSDQVWRTVYYKKDNDIKNVYLKFTIGWDIKRIAYAASFGTDKWEYTSKQTIECAELLKYFNAVSVRECSAVDLCRRYFNRDVEQVLDPTLLLNADDYINLFRKANIPQSKGTLLVYILDETPEKCQLIEELIRKTGLIPFRVNTQESNMNIPLNERIQPPVESWIRGFYDAEFVFTDSFHACVFSIIFNKKFIVYGNTQRGLSRFNSLLKTFGMQNRLITSIEEFQTMTQENIDLSEIINREKYKSISFLKNSLNER